uniref:tol-Pal system protein TolA-like isoform X3 n=1 Tax=Erigeron canadensis TaxID=72917 RepID=UPI001CB8AAE1|nr:tol-Pal system protein TolA-like isoform X3 [Erigeron canadensis]
MEGRNYIPPHLLNQQMHRQLQINTLLKENQNLETTHLSLLQQLSAAKAQLRRLTIVAGEVESGEEGRFGEVYEKFVKMENEVKLVDGLKVELDEMLCGLKELKCDKKEILDKLVEVCIDNVSVSDDSKQVRLVKEEVEALKKEIENGRAVIKQEKRVQASNNAQFEEMKKHKTLMAREIKKLQVEVIDARKRARAAAALEAALNPLQVEVTDARKRARAAAALDAASSPLQVKVIDPRKRARAAAALEAALNSVEVIDARKRARAAAALEAALSPVDI